MRHVAIIILFSSFFSGRPLYSQDSVRQVIEKVFYDEKVFEIIFFDYKGEGEWPFRLPDGKFAFIIPDTTFQKLYPNILYDLAMGWAKERTLHTRTYISHEQGAILLNNNLFHEETIKLLVSIDQIKIDGMKAFMEFHTTGKVSQEEMKNRYVRIKANLSKKSEGWKIRSLSIVPYPCCDNLFPELDRN